jgi:hypothetical protein
MLSLISNEMASDRPIVHFYRCRILDDKLFAGKFHLWFLEK